MIYTYHVLFSSHSVPVLIMTSSTVSTYTDTVLTHTPGKPGVRSLTDSSTAGKMPDEFDPEGLLWEDAQSNARMRNYCK